jgi:hypothetical protein
VCGEQVGERHSLRFGRSHVRDRVRAPPGCGARSKGRG